MRSLLWYNLVDLRVPNWKLWCAWKPDVRKLQFWHFGICCLYVSFPELYFDQSVVQTLLTVSLPGLVGRVVNAPLPIIAPQCSARGQEEGQLGVFLRWEPSIGTTRELAS